MLCARKRVCPPSWKTYPVLALLVEKEEFFAEYDLDYDGGARDPALERIPERPDLLTQILSPLVSDAE